MIAGYELPEQVRSTLSALQAERRSAVGDKTRIAAIDEQIAIFQAEHERLKTEEAERLAREAEELQRAADRAAGFVT